MAGGEGTRLRPMTANQPKPLLPVVNRPIMEHVLRLLKRHGFHETVVTVHFLAALVRNYFGDGSGTGQTVARVIGWAFAVWGTALYWWAGALYAVQARRLLRDDDKGKGAMPDVQRLNEPSAAPADIASTG